jgi:predicted transcriptional regulator of viral defense system
LFGARRVWRDGTSVSVSDRERTLVDCLDDPSLGGGLRHTVEALTVYAEAPGAAWQRLVDYGDKLGNRTVFKRLGYLVERLALADDELIQVCLERRSAGIGCLDPDRPAGGSTSSRWGLRLNALLDG